MALIEPTTKTMVLMFTDLAGSVDLKTRLGATVYAGIISKHDNLFKKILAGIPKSQTIKDTGDGFLARFDTASDAVRAALLFQYALHQVKWEPEPIGVRIGLHIGQVAELEKEDATGLPKLVGLAADLAARVMDLAKPGQILLTRTLFDDARQFIREHPPVNGDAVPAIKWMAHGPYLFKGSDEPMDVFEVGAVGIAPLKEPPDSGKAKRAVRPGEEDLFGWRPAIGLEVPGRPGWTLDRKLGEGGFGEVWLAKQQRIGELRVFKFCFDADRLRSFKREMTLFRLLREALGDRGDIAKLWEVRLDKPPYFLESAFSKDGDLAAWSEKIGGIGTLTMEKRIELIIRICDAVAAAHSIGVLHKDIKPSNILIHVEADGSPRPQLADFGIGVVTDRSQLEGRNITLAGFTETVAGNDSSRTGTRMYSPPELLTGKAFTTKGDVYALGVMLYQVVIGDLSKPLAHGWEHDIADALLREDIAGAVAGDEATRMSGAAELAARLRRLPQRRAERRRQRAFRAIAGAAVLLAVLVVVALILILRERNLREEADTQRGLANAAKKKSDEQRVEIEGLLEENKKRMARLFVEKGWRDDGKNLPQSLLWFVEALKHDPDPSRERLHRMRIGMALSQMPVVTRAMATRGYPYGASHSADGGSLAFHDLEDSGVLLDTASFTSRTFPLKLGQGTALNRDGSRLLTTNALGTLSLWDTAAPENELTSIGLGPDESSRRDVTFSPGGDRFLLHLKSASQLRRTSDLGLIATVASRQGGDGAVFNHDGSRLIVAAEGKAHVYDGVTGKAIGDPISDEDAEIFWALFTPDGSRIITASEDGGIQVLDAQSRAVVKSFFAGHLLSNIVLDRSGARLAVMGQDRQVAVWDVNEARALRSAQTFDHHIYDALFTADSGALLFSQGSAMVQAWPVDRHVPTMDPLKFGSNPWNMSLARDGQVVIVDLSSVRAWDFSRAGLPAAIMTHDVLPLPADTAPGFDSPRPQRNRLYTWLPSGNRGFHFIANAAPDAAGRRFATATTTGQVALWDRDNRVKPAALHLKEPVEFVELSADGKRMLTVTEYGNATLWDTTTSPPKGTRIPASRLVQSAAISPDGTRVVTGDDGGAVMIWDAGNLNVPPNPIATERIAQVRFDPTGRRVLVSHESSFRVLDAATGQAIATVIEPPTSSPIRSIDIAVDGRIIVATDDNKVRLFAADGKPFARGSQVIDVLWQVLFSPDGSRYATHAGEGARVWDSATGQPVSEVMRYDSSVLIVLAFSPDGSLLATGGSDGYARVFVAATGEPVTPRIKHPQAVHQVTFLPNDELLTVAGDSAYIWKLSADARSVEELTHVARLQAAALIDPTLSVVPLTPEQLNESAAKLKPIK